MSSLRCSCALRLSDVQITRFLRLPGALPSIFAGQKVAVVHSMILAIVVEMLGAHSGLGWSNLPGDPD